MQIGRSLLRRLLRHPPSGLLGFGKASYIAKPYCIQGRKHITIGDRVTVGKNSWISAIDYYEGHKYAPKILIDSDTYIGQHVCIIAISNLKIGVGCVLSEYVYITDSAHGLDPTAGLIMKQPLNTKGPVNIGNSTFIGYRACIMPGVTLGKHCIVGANSVVTKSFPDYSMIVGTPANLVKRFSFESNSWINVNV